VQLQNDKGGASTMQCGWAGLEIAAILVGFRIAFEQPVN
jgi:hypothetical protein